MTLVTTEGELCLPSSSRWEQALRRLRHDVYHRPAYVAFDAACAAGRPAGFVYQESGHVFLLPLVLRPIPGSDRVDATSPYGYPAPVSDTEDEGFWDAAVAALRRCLAAEGAVCCFARLHPLLPAPAAALARAGTLVQHGETVSINLCLPEEEMWRQVRGNHRRHINRARRLGRTVVLDDWHHLDAYIAIYHETMRRVGATCYYFFGPRYFAALRDAMGERLHLAVVLAGDVPIGGGLFFEEDGIVQYHLGGSRTDRLPEQPSKLMIDEVRRWGSARGNTVLHLGSGVGGRDNPLFHFKAGFSDARHPFHTWRMVVDAAEYRRLSRAQSPGADPDDRDGYFPAYRTP
jgi:hypothetical protein